MEHLLSVWPRVAEQLENAKHVCLMADYDGTLTPIVGRPELANLPDGVRQLLESMSSQRCFTVGIISGRALADLKCRVAVNGIVYAGNHGLEIEGPGVSFAHPMAVETMPIIRALYQVLRRTLGTVKGVLVEDKGFSLSIHYRQVEGRETGEVKSTFGHIVSSAQALGRIRITQGKKVYEVRPAVAWDKGKAVKLLMKRCGKGGRRSGLWPIYLGDDLTDEDAFRAVKDYGIGISVFVGDANQDTAARYFLKSPAEVAEFLSLLLEHTKEMSCSRQFDG